MLNRTPHQRAMIPPLPYDRWLIMIVLMIIAIGLLMVASASIEISDQRLHQPFYYFYRQLMCLVFGILLGSIVIQLDVVFWEKMGGVIMVGTMLLLALVLMPGIGHAVNGSVRWINLGPLRLQVSELAKLVTVVFMAGYLVRHAQEIRTNVSGFLKPMGLLSVVAVLLLREPDFGATTVVMLTALGMMFLGGMRLRNFLFILILVFSALAILAISAPYRMHRLTSFMNPWANPFGSGYQLTQSLIAFGRGGWLGVGLGKSVQKLFYLPEAHTDFLFAVIVEELGLFGAIAIILLFTLLVLKIFYIGRQSQSLGKHFAGFLAYGFGLWFTIQFTISIGVNSGLLPTKGLTLPLMSYGGSSLLVNCIVIAILLRIDYENRMTVLGIRDG